jgi:hypothetical protein
MYSKLKTKPKLLPLLLEKKYQIFKIMCNYDLFNSFITIINQIEERFV